MITIILDSKITISEAVVFITDPVMWSTGIFSRSQPYRLQLRMCCQAILAITAPIWRFYITSLPSRPGAGGRPGYVLNKLVR